MTYLEPMDVAKMQDEEEVRVSRITINYRIVEMQQQKIKDEETFKILFAAQKQFVERDKKRRGVCWGANMKIKDIKRAFGNIETMSRTAFAKVIK